VAAAHGNYGKVNELMDKVEIARTSSESSGQAFQEIQASMSELKQGSNEILNATDVSDLSETSNSQLQSLREELNRFILP